MSEQQEPNPLTIVRHVAIHLGLQGDAVSRLYAAQLESALTLLSQQQQDLTILRARVQQDATLKAEIEGLELQASQQQQEIARFSELADSRHDELFASHRERDDLRRQLMAFKAQFALKESTIQSLTSRLEAKAQEIATLKQQAEERGDSIVLAAKAERASCIEALERARAFAHERQIMPLDASECIRILESKELGLAPREALKEIDPP